MHSYIHIYINKMYICRSPNGPGLTPWPEFGAEAKYLGIGLEQKPGKNLKAERYRFMTEKLPELVAAAQENIKHAEL